MITTAPIRTSSLKPNLASLDNTSIKRGFAENLNNLKEFVQGLRDRTNSLTCNPALFLAKKKLDHANIVLNTSTLTQLENKINEVKKSIEEDPIIIVNHRQGFIEADSLTNEIKLELSSAFDPLTDRLKDFNSYAELTKIKSFGEAVDILFSTLDYLFQLKNLSKLKGGHEIRSDLCSFQFRKTINAIAETLSIFFKKFDEPQRRAFYNHVLDDTKYSELRLELQTVSHGQALRDQIFNLSHEQPNPQKPIPSKPPRTKRKAS